MSPLPSNLAARRLIASAFPSLPPAPLPSRREVHLWYLIPDELKDASLLQQYMDILPPCEKQKVLSVKGEDHRKCALVSRVLTRTTLSRYTDCRISPISLKFRKNKFGKPEVEWPHDNIGVVQSLQFNVSHTTSLIACGIAVDAPIGIDIEEKQRRLINNILSLARRFFSPHEVQHLNSLVDSESQKLEFLRLWTLKFISALCLESVKLLRFTGMRDNVFLHKSAQLLIEEAYVKALGRGFSGAPFKDFTIRFETGGKSSDSLKPNVGESRILVESTGSENLTINWQFALFELIGSHFAAICMGRDENILGTEQESLKLKVWRTLPFVEDEYVSDTDAVLNIRGLS